MGVKTLAQRIGELALTFYALGSGRAAKYFAYRTYNQLPKKLKVKRQVSLSTPLAHFPLEARVGTSDFDVFKQIFIRREYRRIDIQGATPKWIVDCGANVGYSAAYFATRFEFATVIAVEPDPDNFRLLETNTRMYRDRVIPLKGGIWPRNEQLKLVRGEFGDGREWATQTRIAGKNEAADVTAYSISEILRTFDIPCIDILKIDIEGSEINLFKSQVSEWLPYVEQIVIELHGPDSRRAFYDALKKSEFLYAFHTSGELTIATRI